MSGTKLTAMSCGSAAGGYEIKRAEGAGDDLTDERYGDRPQTTGHPREIGRDEGEPQAEHDDGQADGQADG